MNQRTSRADALDHIRRKLLEFHDIHGKHRCVHRDAENLKELGRSVQPLDGDVQIGYLAESLPIQQRSPLVDAARIHLCGDFRDDCARVPRGLRVALLQPLATPFRAVREKRARATEIDPEILFHEA